MVISEITVKNKSGLHARPASKLVELANKFKCQIFIKKGNTTVDAKSIMGVLSLGASKGSQIVIEANGSDEEEALKELTDLLNSDLLDE